MLKVVKILEGGIDLETQEELPTSIVISNGKREVFVPANDIVIKNVIALYAEDRAQVAPPAPVREAQPARSPKFSRSPKPVSPVLVEEEDFDEGFEPGEEFEDPDTGAGSL